MFICNNTGCTDLLGPGEPEIDDVGDTPWGNDPLDPANPLVTKMLFYHPDYTGNTSCITNANGTLVAKYHYKPYGEVALVEGQDSVLHKFNQQEDDKATGLQYFKARHYDPEIGRFTQADTIIPDPFNSQAYNRYMFVIGNPIRYADPTGHFGTVPSDPFGGGNNGHTGPSGGGGSGTTTSGQSSGGSSGSSGSGGSSGVPDITCGGETNHSNSSYKPSEKEEQIHKSISDSKPVSSLYDPDPMEHSKQELLHDTENDTLHNNPNRLQGLAGYFKAIDHIAKVFFTYIGSKRIHYEVGGVTKTIWLWKGRYGFGLGGEIGSYIKRNGFFKWWYKSDRDNKMKTSLAIYDKATGEKICDGNNTTWWLTVFKISFLAFCGKDVYMKGAITFKTNAEADAFRDSARRSAGLSEVEIVGNTVSFRWD